MTPTDNTIQQWEYRIDKKPVLLYDMGLLLDAAGRRGWELVSINRCFIFWKYIIYRRPKIKTNEHK